MVELTRAERIDLADRLNEAWEDSRHIPGGAGHIGDILLEAARAIRPGPLPNDRCQRCHHRYSEHRWNGDPGGRCCEEVDRYELCECKGYEAHETN